jgi:hypothetical protein
LREYLLCLLAAAAVACLTTPLVPALARRLGVIAEVARFETCTTRPPRGWAGWPMLAGLLAGLLLASELCR